MNKEAWVRKSFYVKPLFGKEEKKREEKKEENSEREP
jgi:hypothetical protein